jgi:hypothetical protein
MNKKLWLIAGIAGMLFGMPQTTVQAEYRGDRYEERGPRRDYDGYRRYDRRHERARLDRIRFEREERRRLRRAEERRRLLRTERHRYERRYERDRRY